MVVAQPLFTKVAAKQTKSIDIIIF